MRNAQLKPAYNVQIGVESEYVTGIGIFQDRNDIATLIPFLDDLEKGIGKCYKNVIADSGYESEENYLYLERKQQTYYIKPQTYEKWKKKSFKKDISKRENMLYDAEKDEYTCHNGKQLNFVEKRQQSYENILTDKGIQLRVNRSIQVEGAFGVLKNDYGFNRFLTRGKNNVKIEFMLLCLGYNINKLHSKIQNDRCGKELYEVKAC